MKKSILYTKTGDTGETALVSGARISKSDKRIDLYGDVDELNSHIGYFLVLLAQEAPDFSSTEETLNLVQSSLFNLGSMLACESKNWDKYKLVGLKEELVSIIETQIDILDSRTEEIKFFILPGGAKSAAYGHIVRTSCRRVERKLVQFSNDNDQVPLYSIELLNRLSDYLFVVSRYVNMATGNKEVPWES